jgi:predicted HicB family RNase H-like nuclease
VKYDTSINIRVDKELLEKLKVLAEADNRSLSDFVRLFLLSSFK